MVLPDQSIEALIEVDASSSGFLFLYEEPFVPYRVGIQTNKVCFFWASAGGWLMYY